MFSPAPVAQCSSHSILYEENNQMEGEEDKRHYRLLLNSPKSWKIRVTRQNTTIICIKRLFTDGMSFPAEETAGNIFKNKCIWNETLEGEEGMMIFYLGGRGGEKEPRDSTAEIHPFLQVSSFTGNSQEINFLRSCYRHFSNLIKQACLTSYECAQRGK